jgi:hypothetical protein
VVAGGLLGHGGGREWGGGGRREEVEDNSFRSSPHAGTACGGRSTAAGGLQAEAAMMAAVGERGKWLGGARRRRVALEARSKSG